MQILRKPLTEPNLACLQHNTTIAAFPTFKIKLPQCNHDRCPPNLHAAAIYSASTRLLGPDICPSSPIGQQAIRSAGPSVLVCNPFFPQGQGTTTILCSTSSESRHDRCRRPISRAYCRSVPVLSAESLRTAARYATPPAPAASPVLVPHRQCFLPKGLTGPTTFVTFASSCHATASPLSYT